MAQYHTVYPKKYAHGFVVLCFVVVMQSFVMNSHEVFIHIHQGCFAGTGAIVRLPQCQWSKPDGYGKISQCITTTKHSKAKTVCIFLGIYCTQQCIIYALMFFYSVVCMDTLWYNVSFMHWCCLLSCLYGYSTYTTMYHLCTDVVYSVVCMDTLHTQQCIIYALMLFTQLSVWILYIHNNVSFMHWCCLLSCLYGYSTYTTMYHLCTDVFYSVVCMDALWYNVSFMHWFYFYSVVCMDTLWYNVSFMHWCFFTQLSVWILYDTMYHLCTDVFYSVVCMDTLCIIIYLITGIVHTR